MHESGEKLVHFTRLFCTLGAIKCIYSRFENGAEGEIPPSLVDAFLCGEHRHPDRDNTGMHPQGEGESGAEAFKSAVAAFYGTQGAKQTSKVNK